jgi:hypothetical protein
VREIACDVDVDQGEEKKSTSLASSRIRMTLEWFVDSIHKSKHQKYAWYNPQFLNARRARQTKPAS